MPTIIPYKIHTELARSFHRDIVNENDLFYVALGKPLPWINEEETDETIDSRLSLADVHRNIMAVKKITSLDTILMVRRIDWETGVIYDEYDDNEDLSNKNFYVMTSAYRIYKCIHNDDNNFSTSDPSETDPLLSEDPPTSAIEKFQTEDGYWWQFMYEVPVSDREKFLTDSLIPVRFYSSSETFDYNGIIDDAEIIDGGSGYSSAPDVVVFGDGQGAVVTATVSGGEVTGLEVVEGGSGYTFALLQFSGGGGSGAEAIARLTSAATPLDINDSVAAYAAATAGSIDWVDVIEAGSGYLQSTTTIEVNGDGDGAILSPVIGGDGTLIGVNVVFGGTGYTYATAEVISPSGVGATVRLDIGPFGGHGSNIPQELMAATVAIAVTIEDYLEDFFINNDFRQISIIKNPRVRNGSAFFDELTGNANYVMEVSDTTKYLVDDEILTNTGGEFVVVHINTEDGLVYLQAIIDKITVMSVLENVRSAESGLTMLALTEPEFDKRTGTIIYLQTTAPILRQEDQIETIKLYFNF